MLRDRPSRNCVPRQDAKNESRVAAKIAEHKAKKLREKNPDSYNPDCPPPLLSTNCYLLKKSPTFSDSNPTYQLVLYNDPECLDSQPTLPQGNYAYVCVYNEARQENEIRCGSNEDGMNVHLTLSGNAAFVAAAGELLFSKKGKLLLWNLYSGSYRPDATKGVDTGFSKSLYRETHLSYDLLISSSVPSKPTLAGLAGLEFTKLLRKERAVDDSVLNKKNSPLASVLSNELQQTLRFSI